MLITIWDLTLFVNVCLFLNPLLKFGKGYDRIKWIKRDFDTLKSYEGVDVLKSPQINLSVGMDFVSETFDINKVISRGNEKMAIAKVLDDHIQAHVDEFLHMMQFVPVSFLPGVDKCCDTELTLSSTGRTVKVFTKLKTYHSRAYSATCKKCKVEYGYGFREMDINGEKRRFYSRGRFFLLTKESIFEESLLLEFTSTLILSRSHFNQMADIYNREKTDMDKLDPDILINTFIVWNSLRRLPEYGILILPRSLSNRHMNVELMCTEVIPELQQTFQVWKHHKCNDVGCSARVAIVDGNNKNKRKICIAKGEKLIATDKSQWNTYKKCINNPKRKESKYCEEHMNGAQAETTEQQDLRIQTRQWAREMESMGLLPELEDDTQMTDDAGCRKKENIKKESDHTAGILMWVRSCLLRLHLSEIYHAESLSQWTTSMIDTFGLEPTTDIIQWVCGDRACEFEPFITKRAIAGNIVLRKYVEILEDKCIVDTFHGDKHTKDVCKDHGVLAKFNARLDKFAHLKGTNYEAAEQTFIKINQTSGTTNYMTYGKRLCLLIIINDEFNTWLEDTMKDKLITSGRKLQQWRKIDDEINRRNKNWKFNLPGFVLSN